MTLTFTTPLIEKVENELENKGLMSETNEKIKIQSPVSRSISCDHHIKFKLDDPKADPLTGTITLTSTVTYSAKSDPANEVISIVRNEDAPRGSMAKIWESIDGDTSTVLADAIGQACSLYKVSRVQRLFETSRDNDIRITKDEDVEMTSTSVISIVFEK